MKANLCSAGASNGNVTSYSSDWLHVAPRDVFIVPIFVPLALIMEYESPRQKKSDFTK